MTRPMRSAAVLAAAALWLAGALLPPQAVPQPLSTLLPATSSAIAAPADSPAEQSAASTPYTGRIVVSATALGAHSVQSADLDTDGRVDLIAAGREDGQIVWHRNLGGLRFTPRLLTVAPGTYMIVPADVNRDGKTDVVAVAVGTLAPSAASAEEVAPAANDGAVFWLKNNLPASATFTRQDIAGGLAYPVAVHVADIEGDGDPDVMVTTRDANQVLLFENGGSGDVPVFGNRVIDGALSGAVSVYTGDLDGNGKLDIVAAGENGNQISWYRNNGARPAGFDRRFVRNGPVPDPALDYAKSVNTGDVDGDGDVDVIFGSEQENVIGWYENQNRGGAWVEHVLAADADHAKFVTSSDVDRDGDLDILAASSDNYTVEYFENDGNAAPTFTRRLITNTAVGARSVHAADFDSDGDIDIATASRDDNQVVLYVNNSIHRSAVLEGERIVTTYSQTRSVAAADIDDDGRPDIVSTSNNIVAWHRNLGGSPPSFASSVIDNSFQGGRWVTTGDLDGDGDIDVVAADRTTNRIVAYFNQLRQSGSVAFAAQVVTSDAMRVRDVNVADLDNDGDMDLYSATDGDNTIAWYENTDGSGRTFAKRIVTQSVDYPRSSFAADVDADGWLDLLSASAQDDSLTLFRQTSRGVFSQQTLYSQADGAQFVYADDIDGDNDIDLLLSSELDNTIAWFANRLRAGRGFERFVVSNTAAGVHAAITADMDGDGDKDIVGAIEYADKIVWYENGGGFTPTFTEHLISPFADVAHGVFAADLDTDGDIDVLSASRADGKVAWYENRGGQFGIAQSQPGGGSGNSRVLNAAVLSSRGRSGDPDLWLRGITLRFETRLGQRLSAGQASDLFSAVSIYRDNGDGQFNPAVDARLVTQTSFPLNNGEMTLDVPNAPTAAAAATRYFVVGERRNQLCNPDSIRVTVISNNRTAADGVSGVPLLGEYMRNLSDSGDPTQGRKPPIVINEIMADNLTTLVDPQEPQEYPDWFELYNTSEFFIDLGGTYLTDDAANLRQYRIPDGVVIAPFGYLVFIADGEPEQGPLHTSFSLSKDGETLVLYDVDARGNQVIDQISFESMAPDVSIGRSPVNSSQWTGLDAPTPGRYNQDIVASDFVYLPSITTPNACY